ncbi:excalibur calcium-binding domain-containing protein [Amnibacterium kyonggiense]|uniref:excalibur calcium-binding domain-containing protein n=1 Tax=Amnibacterium kyonggiense TaxID=595671 RepID=UPI0031D851CF
MRRLLAITTATTTIALGALVPITTASAMSYDGNDTVWKTSVENPSAAWSGTTLKVEYDWDTFNENIVSATFVTSVDGTVADTVSVDTYDYATKAVRIARTASAAPAKVTIAANFCLDDGSGTPSCSGGTVYSKTVFLTSKGVKAGQASAVTLLNSLKVAKESKSSSYKRSKFGDGWVDANRDGENTRAEVLKAESKKKVVISRSGTVKTGKWSSAYDGKTFTVGSKLDIDHLVPLKEAWISGAASWSTKKRTAYANDLGYGASLIAVSKHANRSKGDKDPASYLPQKSYRCAYVRNYVAVKARWKLSIDSSEKTAITNVLASCSSYGVKKPGTPNIANLLPKPKPKPVSHSGGGSSAGGSVYYANCAAVRAAGKAPLYAGQPGYATPRLDRDGDGIACE